MAGNEFTPDQMGLLAAMILGKKSGADFSSILNDPFLAYLSGASQGRQQLSEGELYARYAPTFLYIQDNEPDTSWKKQAASLIANGVPVYRVKEEIQSFLANNPDQQGMYTSKDVDSFVEGLAKEHQAVQSEQLKQVENDPFAKAGYPSPSQQYTMGDIANMAPEAFSALQQKADAARPEYEKLIAGIDDKYGTVMKPKPAEKVSKGEGKKSPSQAYSDVMTSETAKLIASNTISRQTGIPQSQVLNPNKSDRRQAAAHNAYLQELKKNAESAQRSATPSEFGVGDILKSVAGKATGIDSALRLGSSLKGIFSLLNKPHRSVTNAEKENLPQGEKQPEMVVDQAATARNKTVADVAKGLLARRVGMPGYYEEAMGLLAQNIQNDLAKSGRTPLTDALIKSAVLARATRNG